MNVTCSLDYFEKTLEVPTEPDGTRRSVRDYQKVSAAVKVGEGKFEPTLRPEHRLIGVEAGKQTAVLFSPAGNLTRDELDAIDIPGNSLLVDRMLPDKPVAVGDTLAAFRTTDGRPVGVGRGGQEQRPAARSRKLPTRWPASSSPGKWKGPSTASRRRSRCRGKYRFDLRSKRIDWFAMLFQADWDEQFRGRRC